MTFVPKQQLDELSRFAWIADREARSDLSRGYIRNEDDYTSNFTGALRRIINSNSHTGLQAVSLLLQPSEERKSGTDAAIILVRGGKSKIALFEAKWPRFKTTNYKWDYPQTASGKSHFSDQLARQGKYCGQFAVFEMFYCEYELGAQPSFLQADGSTCAWHTDAQTFQSKRNSADAIWKQTELQTMLSKNNSSIAEIITKVGECLEGQPISMSDPEGIASEFGLPHRILSISFSD